MTPIDGPPCPGPGFRLVDRIGALQRPVELHRIRWRLSLSMWDLLRAGKLWRPKPKRRRGVPVS